MPSILQNQVKQAEFCRTVWSAHPEPGITLDEVSKPEYWMHVAKTIRVGDRLEVTASDGSWFAELYVRASNGASIAVHVMRHIEFPLANIILEDVEVKHRGDKGWSVIRKADKKVLFEKGQVREDAERWLKAGGYTGQ